MHFIRDRLANNKSYADSRNCIFGTYAFVPVMTFSRDSRLHRCCRRMFPQMLVTDLAVYVTKILYFWRKALKTKIWLSQTPKMTSSRSCHKPQCYPSYHRHVQCSIPNHAPWKWTHLQWINYNFYELITILMSNLLILIYSKSRSE